jgi:sugar phosphate permease
MYRRWAIFTITSFNFFLSQFYRSSNAVIAPDLLRDLGLDTAGLGLMSAAFFYAFALTQIPLSVLLDRIGARKMMTGLSLLGITGALIFAWSGGLHQGIAGRVLLGIGMACNLMGTFKLLTMWFPASSFGTLSGSVFSIGFIGNIAATTPLVLLVQWLGWRMAFSFIAFANFILVIVLFCVVRDRPNPEAAPVEISENLPATHSALKNMNLLLKNRDYWIISFGTFVGYGSFAAFQALWAGPYLIEVMGLSPFHAGNILLMVNLGLIIGSPMWGAFTDRVFCTRKWVILPGLFFSAATMVGITLLKPGATILPLVVLFFLFGLARTSNLLMYTHIKELMPIDMAGAAMTGINFFTMMGPAVFLQGLGVFMQNLYPHASRGPAAFRAAFILCTSILVLAGILYFFAKDPERSEAINQG